MEDAGKQALEAALDAVRPLEGTAWRERTAATLEECRRIFRLKLGPAASDGKGPPLVVVAGGTNVGKTTVANALAGAELGRPTPLARGTKAAVIYASAATADAFRRAGFLPGYERRDLAGLDDPNRDEAAGTLLVLPHPPAQPPRATDSVALADSPDIDSVFKKNQRVAWDLLYAADALVFVASEEKYNDEVCVSFLARAARHGKTIVAILNKSAAPEALEDFRKNVVPRAGAQAPRGFPPIETIALPYRAPAAGELADADFEPARAALGRLARDPAALATRARAGAAAALAEEAEPALSALRREAELLEHYRTEVRAVAAAAARRYRASLAALPIVEFDRVFRLLADALRVPVIDDFYARLREAGRPIADFFRRAFGGADAATSQEKRLAARDRRDLEAARIELGEALAAARRVADRYPADVADALRAALAGGAEAERLHALDREYADSLAREAARWTDQVLRELHARLRARPGFVVLVKALKGVVRASAAGAAIVLTGHVGLEDLAVAPAIDLLVKTGVEAGIDRAYFAAKRDEFYDARAAVFARLATERVEALALARLCGATAEAIANLATAIKMGTVPFS